MDRLPNEGSWRELGKRLQIKPRLKMYDCAHCDRTYQSKMSLQQHLRIHTGTKWKCEVCNQELQYTTSIKRHLLTHTDERPFACELCEKRFKGLYYLKQHMLTHTDEKPFVCELCGKRFRLRSTLKGHLLTHTSLKPFQCELCGASFRFKCNLTAHKCGVGQTSDRGRLSKHKKQIHGKCVKLTHTKHVKSHTCSVCSKAFMFQKQLEDHFCTHTEKRPIPQRNTKNPENANNFEIYAFIGEKDWRHLKKAFHSTEDFICGMNEYESLHHWFRMCSQMQDSCVLFYECEEITEEFTIVIMTEFQKQILLTSNKQIVCIDTPLREKDGRLYLTALMVLDERKEAFPAAFCISSKVDENVIRQFVASIRDSTGPLTFAYFMSDADTTYYSTWQEVMQDDSKWLWSKWFVDRNFAAHIRRGKVLATDTRADLFKRLKVITECKDRRVFEAMFKKFTEDVTSDPNMKRLVLETYAPRKDSWAHCYHKDVKLRSLKRMEAMHQTLRFCCRQGRKKRLDKFVFAMMKLMRFKMMDRLSTILPDDERISHAKESILTHHKEGLSIPADSISSVGERTCLIKDEEGDIFVVRDCDTCPDACLLQCSECSICMHMYSCSCVRNTLLADICPHIHAVVWKFASPQFSPKHSAASIAEHGEVADDGGKISTNQDMESSAPFDYGEIVNDGCKIPSDKDMESLTPFDTVLEMTQDFLRKIQACKSSLDERKLDKIKTHLNICINVCSNNEDQSCDEAKSDKELESSKEDDDKLVKEVENTSIKWNNVLHSKSLKDESKVSYLPNTYLFPPTNSVDNSLPNKIVIPDLYTVTPKSRLNTSQKPDVGKKASKSIPTLVSRSSMKQNSNVRNNTKQSSSSPLLPKNTKKKLGGTVRKSCGASKSKPKKTKCNIKISSPNGRKSLCNVARKLKTNI